MSHGVYIVLFCQSELPLAAAAFVCDVGVAAEALAGDAVVYSLAESRILNDAHRLAGMKSHALLCSCVLYTALDGGVGEGVALDLDLVLVDIGVQTQAQSPGKSLQTGAVTQTQKRLYLLCLNNGKTAPGPYTGTGISHFHGQNENTTRGSRCTSKCT